jgi:glycosyltransferase involved in cell wall biosynthesis
MTNIHALILTLDEEQHIARCISSIRNHCDTITVIDSGSRDCTRDIANELGADVIMNPFVNHAKQLNFGIDYLAKRGGWLLRIDADEIVDGDSAEGLKQAIRVAPVDCDGLLVRRRIYFLGRRIKFGGVEPSWQLRLWRNGTGRCEQRWMDEHIMVQGRVERSRVVLSDINLKSLTWWTEKHNSYASREAIEILNNRHNFLLKPEIIGKISPQASTKRWIKNNLYAALPLGKRTTLYFWYRYVMRLGFLDGLEGYIFHMLQGRWYRTLVDAKVMEIELLRNNKCISFPEAIKICTGIDISQEQNRLSIGRLEFPPEEIKK